MGCELSSGGTVMRVSSAWNGAGKGREGAGEGAASSCGKMRGEIVEEDLLGLWPVTLHTGYEDI